MDLGLRGKVVMVTGGAGRIRPVICQAFAREGALVAVLDVAADRAEATAASVRSTGAQAIGVAVDVLVNAHGIAPNRPLLQADEAEWDRTFAVNTRATMLTCRAVGNQMIDRGCRGAIVNVSSGAATSARLGAAGYSGSKAAINMLTEALAIELGPHGIRVNAVAPGLVTDNPLRAAAP